jgi:hypothetical protein
LGGRRQRDDQQNAGQTNATVATFHDRPPRGVCARLR